MSAHERDWLIDWGWAFVRLLLYVLIAAAICGTLFFGGSLLHGTAPVPIHPEREVAPDSIKGGDFNGLWDMRWGSSPFRQTLDRRGTAECAGEHDTYLGSWTSAKAGEVTISETCHTLPEYMANGPEITFTLTVKRAVKRGSRIVRLEMEGPYQGTRVKVVLTPFVFR